MPEAAGEFRITGMGGEDPIAELDGRRLTHASGTQAFTGGIEGTGHIDWLMCYLPDRTATFVGLQQVDATLDGRRGTFVMTSTGRHDGRASEGRWSIVEGSGTGELAGITGSGEWRAGPGPEGSYRLSYRP
jgi:hypothetical protein